MRKIKEQYIVSKEGKKIAVIIPIEEFEELLEDLHDLAIISERKDEPAIPLEDLREKLIEDGIL